MKSPVTRRKEAISNLLRGRPSAKVRAQLAEDVGREDEWRAIAEAHIRDADAVTGRRVLHGQGHGGHDRNLMAVQWRLPHRSVRSPSPIDSVRRPNAVPDQ